ncbi:MAG: protein-disulfide reductase DsbD family protein [Rudaea sp.]|uniref:protein-disulfide reductase DsbD domain-containing protein n=1 Tax=Rudaea sp. TaxID=2136325 RepID=UPI0039E3BD5D
MRNSIRCLCLPFACLAPMALPAAPTTHFDGDHIKIDLMLEQMPAPGQTAWMGVVLTPDPGWHTYWVNPGDSGLPTKLAWTLPAGFKAGEIAWPAPKRIKVGDLYNFGYDGIALLPVPIEVPPDAPPGSVAHLAVTVKWLVCHEECVPGKAELSFDLPIRNPVPAATKTRINAVAQDFSQSDALFGDARRRLPIRSGRQAHSVLGGDRIEVTLHDAGLPTSATLDALAVQTGIVANTPPKVDIRGDDIVFTFAKSDYFTSIPERFDLVLTDGNANARLVHAPFGDATPSPSAKPRNPP